MGNTAKRWAVEAKVIAAAAASAGAGIGLAVLNDIEADHTLMGSTPAWLQALVLIAAPPLATFLAGYTAPHTPRTDSAGQDATGVR